MGLDALSALRFAPKGDLVPQIADPLKFVKLAGHGGHPHAGVGATAVQR
jgi:hypothetical protein